MARKYYARLSPEEIDEVCVRLKSGQAAKVTVRQLGLPRERCAPTWCAAAGFDRSRDGGGQGGNRGGRI